MKEGELQDNRAHTGKYVWPKETLIDATFPDVLDRMVKEFPDQILLSVTPTLDYTRTYSEFRDDVDQFARALIAMGVKKGDHVAIWATNVPQWYITFWATTKIGAVLVTVNTAYKIHEAEYLLRQSDTHTLVMIDGYKDSDYVGIIKELCPELQDSLPGKLHSASGCPCCGTSSPSTATRRAAIPGSTPWAWAIPFPPPRWRTAGRHVNKDDVCNMQYTSGTTGFPKGVMLTHYNVVNNGKAIGDCMDLSTADRMMIQVPMFHCFGMVLAMTAAMTHGTTMCPITAFSPRKGLHCINQEKITAFHGVPTMFIAMLEHPDFDKTDFSHMRTGIMAGSPCPVKVMQDVVDKMHMTEICITYGQTEASPGCTMSQDHRFPGCPRQHRGRRHVRRRVQDRGPGDRRGSARQCGRRVRGQGLQHHEGLLQDARGHRRGHRQGRLAAHRRPGPPRLPRATIKITGRIKDMIIRGGENIYPKEIEDFIYTHPKVRDVQVIGVPDEQYGEEIMACVILKEGRDHPPRKRSRIMSGTHMAKHKVPRYVDLCRGLPHERRGQDFEIQDAGGRREAFEAAGGQLHCDSVSLANISNILKKERERRNALPVLYRGEQKLSPEGSLKSPLP